MKTWLRILVLATLLGAGVLGASACDSEETPTLCIVLPSTC